MNSTKPNTIAEFLEYIEKKYGKSASWIGERAGLSGSTARRWKTQTKPYAASLNLIEAVVSKDFPNELELFREIRNRLDAPVCKEYEMATSSKVLSGQMKEIEGIIKNRYPDSDDDFIQGACGAAAKLLVEHGYDTAIAFANTFTVRKEEEEDPVLEDAMSDYNEFVKSLPKVLTLEETDFCQYSYKIGGVDGFYADILPTPHSSIAIYLWHEHCGQKMLIADLDQVKTVDVFGNFIRAAEVVLQDNFSESIIDYLRIFMSNDEDLYENENGDIVEK